MSDTGSLSRDELADAMLRHGFFAHDGNEIPEPALRWIDAFLDAYGDRATDIDGAIAIVRMLRSESVVVPALALERLRNRQVIFFLDTVGQYVDSQPELRGLPLAADLLVMAEEFGIDPADANWAVRMALTAADDGPPLEAIFPLLGHDRILMRFGAISSHLLHGRGLEPLRAGPGGKPFAPITGKKPETAAGAEEVT